jgi:hypothetical protein
MFRLSAIVYSVKFFFPISLSTPLPPPAKGNTGVRLRLDNSRFISHHFEFINHELSCQSMLYRASHCPWRSALLNTQSKLMLILSSFLIQCTCFVFGRHKVRRIHVSRMWMLVNTHKDVPLRHNNIKPPGVWGPWQGPPEWYTCPIPAYGCVFPSQNCDNPWCVS